MLKEKMTSFNYYENKHFIIKGNNCRNYED